MEERGIRRLLPYCLPLLGVVALLAGAQPGADAAATEVTAGVAATGAPTSPPVPATAPPGTVAPAPPTTSPPAPARVATTPPAPRTAPPPATPGQPAPAPQLAGGTWAVVIGVNDYPRAADLHFAEADAQDVATALSGLGTQADHLRMLTGAAATGPAVRAALDWLVAHAGPDALAVVFFAGHVRRLGPGSEGLGLADESVLADSELAERLAGLHARRAWITVAACFGGGFTEVLAPGRVLTGAAAAGENAYETTEFDRSYLVRYMIREALIERRSAPTVQDAFAYAAARQRHDFRPVQFEMDAPVMDLRS